MVGALDDLVLVERLGRHGELIERQRFVLPAGAALRIGRDIRADVLLLDDPHVALHHADLQRDAEGRLLLIDTGSLNGLFDEADGARRAQVVIDAPRTVRLGHCRLRVVDGRHPQEAERPLPPPSGRQAVFAFALLLAAMALSLLLDWLEQVGEVRSSALLTAGMAGALLMLGWAFGWSLVTRLFGGELRFLRHLRVVATGSLLASVMMLAVTYLSYGLLFEPLSRYAYAVYWLLFAAVCFAHLRVLGAGHRRLKAVLMVALAAIGIGLQSLALWQPRGGEQRTPRYVESVAVPAFRLRALQGVPDYFARAAVLQAELDAQRAGPDDED